MNEFSAEQCAKKILEMEKENFSKQKPEDKKSMVAKIILLYNEKKNENQQF